MLQSLPMQPIQMQLLPVVMLFCQWVVCSNQGNIYGRHTKSKILAETVAWVVWEYWRQLCLQSWRRWTQLGQLVQWSQMKCSTRFSAVYCEVHWLQEIRWLHVHLPWWTSKEISPNHEPNEFEISMIEKTIIIVPVVVLMFSARSIWWDWIKKTV